MSFSRQRFIEIANRWYPSAFTVTETNEEERTQLLNTTSIFRTTCWEKFWIVIIAVIFLVGVSASTYLLIVEGRDPVPHDYALVSQAEWSSLASCRNTPKLQLPVERILLLPTNTTECWDGFECLEELKNLQQDHINNMNATDIPYNFILTGDNRIYEGRGWNCSANYDSDGDKLFSVAFLGKYDDRPPTARQVRNLESFLEDSILDNRVSPCYQILTLDSTTTYITDVAFKLRERRRICVR